MWYADNSINSALSAPVQGPLGATLPQTSGTLARPIHGGADSLRRENAPRAVVVAYTSIRCSEETAKKLSAWIGTDVLHVGLPDQHVLRLTIQPGCIDAVLLRADVDMLRAFGIEPRVPAPHFDGGAVRSVRAFKMGRRHTAFVRAFARVLGGQDYAEFAIALDDDTGLRISAVPGLFVLALVNPSAEELIARYGLFPEEGARSRNDEKGKAPARDRGSLREDAWTVATPVSGDNNAQVRCY